MNARRERRRSSKTGPTSSEIRERWPLHWLVWEGRDAELEVLLREGEVNNYLWLSRACNNIDRALAAQQRVYMHGHVTALHDAQCQ